MTDSVKVSEEAQRKAFHKHVDECAQCRERPFALCEKGAKLLRDAALTTQQAGEENG